jgi:hypothetical protein
MAQGVAQVHGQREWAVDRMSEFDRLIGEMEARIKTLVEATLERLSQRFPGWETDSAFSRRQAADFVELSLQGCLAALRRETLPQRCPEVDATAARTVARVGEIDAFANGYRAAQAALWEMWFCLVEDSGLQGDERRQLLSRGSDFFFRYADLLGDFVTVVYREEREALHADASQRRFNAVKVLLEGEQPPSANGIDIDLHQHHLGLIGWGENCEAGARALAKELGRPAFLVTPLPGTCWSWISGSRPLEDPLRRRIGRFQVPAGSQLALGMEEFGEHGFRTTHRQAQRARLLADQRRPVTRYADVAIEALASENTEEARRFVARELGAMNDESPTSQRLRETLAAYFAAEHNAASAAATLGVHQQTVANRLRAAEERIGHQVGARRVELELALRLRDSLGAGEEVAGPEE